MPEVNDLQSELELDGRQVYTVQQLNQKVKQLLQQGLPLLWIEGEISNLAQPASGHMYFSLKDERAQVRCTMFHNANRQLTFQPGEGMHVLAKARAGLYEPRGEYQLNIEYMEESGVGALQRRYEELKRKLSQSGLFDEIHKQGLPAFPQNLGVVTSLTGAAIRDILSVLRRRFPLLSVRIYAVPVQGEKSAEAIVNAIQTINQHKNCDVIILARGGGSIEDLWSFNEEAVAQAIFASKIPIITGIGHEIDFTIADFVADMRAATPSAAAELVTPHHQELTEVFEKHKKSLFYLARDIISNSHQSVDRTVQRLEFLHPRQTIQKNKQRLAELKRRASSTIKLNLTRQYNQLNKLLIKMENRSPKLRVYTTRVKFSNTSNNLNRLLHTQLRQKNQQLKILTRALSAVSPQSVLDRGYAIAMRAKDNQVLRNADQVSVNEKILIQLAKGQLSAQINKK